MISSFSSSPATVSVDKATSELLIGPDWTMNIDICDSVNSHHWQAKEVVKALKKRLQHKNPKVQLLALTLLETMVKNCGDYIHFQIAEKNILGEMVKIVKKKTDMQVRNKILVLVDSWQEAFGGPGRKHPQYYWAYEELRRSGVEFPQRSSDTALIFTPPVTIPTIKHTQAGYGMPSNSSRRLDEAMATEVETLSLSSLDSMRNVMDLLTDMLQAVTPTDHAAVKDEVIVDLVDRCRANQKMLMHMLTTTGDEELLAHGLELNDSMQILLAKHDAISSGSPLLTQAANFSTQSTEVSASSLKPTQDKDSSPRPNADHSASVTTVVRSQFDEEEEEEDEFAQLAQRHSKLQPVPSQSTSTGTTESLSSGNTTASTPAASNPVPCTALALADPPAPVRTMKEQDMIDLLSLTLSTSASPHPPAAPNQNMHQVPAASATQEYSSYSTQAYPENQGQLSYNSYVVPWAQPQSQPQLQSHYPQYSPSYPAPPWSTTAPAYSNQNPSSAANTFLTPHTNPAASYTPFQVDRPLQHFNSFPARGIDDLAMHGDAKVSPNPRNPPPAAGQKPFVPSYRLFEDLNVLSSVDGRLKTASNKPPGMTGTSSQGIVGGRK